MYTSDYVICSGLLTFGLVLHTYSNTNKHVASSVKSDVKVKFTKLIVERFKDWPNYKFFRFY